MLALRVCRLEQCNALSYLFGSAGCRGQAMDLLKLVALDGDDIEVISTHLQDAVVKAADVRWRPAEKRLVVGLNRFDWQAANGPGRELRRRRAALRFERVSACKCRNCTNCSPAD